MPISTILANRKLTYTLTPSFSFIFDHLQTNTRSTKKYTEKTVNWALAKVKVKCQLISVVSKLIFFFWKSNILSLKKVKDINKQKQKNIQTKKLERALLLLAFLACHNKTSKTKTNKQKKRSKREHFKGFF